MWWGVHLLANDAILHAYIALQDLMFIIVHPFSTSMIVGRIVATLQELTQLLGTCSIKQTGSCGLQFIVVIPTQTEGILGR